MTTITLPTNARTATNSAANFDIGPVARTAISLACFTMSFAVVVALGKAAFGMVEGLHHYAKLPIIIHVAAVQPTIPLGGWLLLARKGTTLHKQLGKVWLVLMLITATSAIFIQSNVQLQLDPPVRADDLPRRVESHGDLPARRHSGAQAAFGIHLPHRADAARSCGLPPPRTHDECHADGLRAPPDSRHSNICHHVNDPFTAFCVRP